ncbi:MAG: hypothetical protein ACKPKO_10535, partial [Candidatus Fonsibacter sp.]
CVLKMVQQPGETHYVWSSFSSWALDIMLGILCMCWTLFDAGHGGTNRGLLGCSGYAGQTEGGKATYRAALMPTKEVIAFAC